MKRLKDYELKGITNALIALIYFALLVAVVGKFVSTSITGWRYPMPNETTITCESIGMYETCNNLDDGEEIGAIP